MPMMIRLSEFDDASSALRELLKKHVRAGQSSEGGGWKPPVDIYETPSSVILVAEVAGVSSEEVQVIVDGQVVRIYGHRQPTCCSPGARYHRMEIAAGSFVRSFRIAVPFDAAKVQAKVEDGLLYVILPKSPAPAAQKITVQGE